MRAADVRPGETVIVNGVPRVVTKVEVRVYADGTWMLYDPEEEL